MSLIDIERLLEPTVIDSPCGADLMYDPDFLALEDVTRSKAEQQYGDTFIPAVPPDWREVERRALDLMSRTKDLRVVVALCRAWTNTRGLSGFLDGLNVLVELLERYWEEIHPQPEGQDFFIRMKAVLALTDPMGMLGDLRDAEFLRMPHGTVTVREAENLAHGAMVETAGSLSCEQLAQALNEHFRTNKEVSHPCVDAYTRLLQMRSLCEEKLSLDDRPDLAPLASLLKSVSGLVAPALPGAIKSDGAPVGHDAPSPPSQPPERAAIMRSREESMARLLEVAMHIEQTEPANPAPLLIRRAVRMMEMNFVDIIRDLSPEILGNVELVAGVKFSANN